ncbi:hypothetical protein ACZ11_07600 [Lysinibacillus xylanilyticus]|uniref:Uncharacterized protein n=1 Tax=Lysinibacillus xylanilyticus TaxID=582475 RepID=A0A0K9FD41_9BACI|nr:hypothetical protein [Lysinibacillus xylanilyticus]KMY32026.1 hypothetical protein ACZ11_07600 [Lysinibacillus xylanilyticus]
MSKEELYTTKREMSFIEKSVFTITSFVSVTIFLLLWAVITLGIYIGKYGNSVSKVSIVITVFILPPFFTYIVHRFFLIYFFKRQYISKQSLIKLKNFFGNLSLVLLAVLSTAKNFIPTKKFEEFSEPPNFLKDPIGYIEHFCILILHPVNSTYTIPLVFAIMAFIFSFLETSNFATYKIYIPKEKVNKAITKKEITKQEIIYLQNIVLDIKNNLNNMQIELNNLNKN